VLDGRGYRCKISLIIPTGPSPMQLGEQNGVAHDNWEVYINSIGVWRIKLYAVKE